MKKKGKIGVLVLLATFLAFGNIYAQETATKAMAKGIDKPKIHKVSFTARILITDSHTKIEQWVLSSENERLALSGHQRVVHINEKLYYPFVVTGYTVDSSGRVDLTADFQLISPRGEVCAQTAKIATANRQDPRAPGIIVLEPVLDLTFDEKDQPGTYTIRTIITDHIKSEAVTAEETFRLVKDIQ